MKNRFSIFTTLTFCLVLFTACGGGGGGDDTGTNPITNPAVPTTPAGLTATVISSDQINLSWYASTDDVGVMGYNVYKDGGTPTINLGTSRSYYGLNPGSQYCFSVSAFDGDANESTLSNAVCATTDSTSTPGSQWTKLQEGTTTDFKTVVWTGTQLVAAGHPDLDHNAVLTSSDGLDWTVRDTTGLSETDSMVYGDSQFVAIENWMSEARVYTSSDGVSWSRQAIVKKLDSTNLVDIAWSPPLGLYVMVGWAGQIFTSPNAVNWTPQTSNTSSHFEDVTWLNDRFFAVGDNTTILSSSNGVVWELATPPVPSDRLSAISWNGQTDPGLCLYVATGNPSVLLSNDGVNWTEAVGANHGVFYSLVWSDALGLFAGVGWNGDVFTSPDGVSWTRRFLSEAPTSATEQFYEVVWTGSRFVAVGDNGTVIYSDDGITWLLASKGSDLEAVKWDGSQWIGVGAYGRYVTSPDATHWTNHYLGATSFLYDIAWSPSLYIATGGATVYSSDLSVWEGSGSNFISDISIIYDDSKFVRTDSMGILIWDGVTFSSTNDPKFEYSLFKGVVFQFRDIVWTGSQYVAVGDNGKIYTSPDATTTSIWTPQSSGTTDILQTIVWTGSQYVVAGSNGIILTSPDAITWTHQTSGTTETLKDIVWTGTVYYVVGKNRTILTSTDGISWTAEISLEGYYYNGIGWNGTDLVIVGDKGLILKRN